MQRRDRLTLAIVIQSSCFLKCQEKILLLLFYSLTKLLNDMNKNEVGNFERTFIIDIGVITMHEFIRVITP